MQPALLSISVSPRTPADGDRLSFGLRRIAEEDATVRVTVNKNGVVTVHGLSELHLEIVIDRLKREFGVQAFVGPLDVALKETVAREADGTARFVGQIGGRSAFAHVRLHLSPGARGGGCIVEHDAAGSIPAPFIAAIDDGVKAALAHGVIAGYPIDDVRVVVYDGAHHESDSSDHSFRIAGSLALVNALERAEPVLLEPLMRVNVLAPAEYRSDLVDDIARRRGRIESTLVREQRLELSARVPLAEMLGYATRLRGFTRGRGSYTMRFDQYEPLEPDRTGDDRGAPVTSPLHPRLPNRTSAIAMPEPDDDWCG